MRDIVVKCDRCGEVIEKIPYDRDTQVAGSYTTTVKYKSSSGIDADGSLYFYATANNIRSSSADICSLCMMRLKAQIETVLENFLEKGGV